MPSRARTVWSKPAGSPIPQASPGLVLAKLDGTAKGGIVVAITRELGLPIRYVGVGERADDLVPFDAKTFVRSLFEG